MTCLHCFVMTATLAAVALRANSGELTLYHLFRSGADGQWVEVRIPLQAGAWRMGRPDGRTASPAELSEVLHSLGSVALAVHCPGETQGPTHYPCAVELRNAHIEKKEGSVPAPVAGWSGATGDTMRLNGGTSVLTYSSAPGLSPTLDLLPAGVLPATGMLALVAPPQVVLQLRGPDVKGLTFHWRVQANEVARTNTLPSQGMLIVTTRRQSSTGPTPARL
jgi:hypothetical protein